MICDRLSDVPAERLGTPDYRVHVHRPDAGAVVVEALHAQSGPPGERRLRLIREGGLEAFDQFLLGRHIHAC